MAGDFYGKRKFVKRIDEDELIIEGIDRPLFIYTVRQFHDSKKGKKEKKDSTKLSARRILKFPKSHSTAL